MSGQFYKYNLMSSQLFPSIAVLSFVVLLLILLLRRLKQPYFIAYIVAGLVLGPECLNFIYPAEVVSELGEIGIVLLMFSIGTGIDLNHLKKNFYKPLFIAFVQIILSFLCMYGIGYEMDWNINIVILISFIISLSSSAIVFQYLMRTGEIKSQLGIITCGLLLIQDILVLPMILALNIMSGSNASSIDMMKVCIGCSLVFLFYGPQLQKNF